MTELQARQSLLASDTRTRVAAMEPALAAVLLVALGFRQVLHTELTSGYLLAFLFAPVWFHAIRLFGGARMFLVLGTVAAAWGVLVSKIGLPPHMISGADRNNNLVILFGTLAGVAVVLWARTLLSISAIVLAYGVGMLLGGAAGFTSPGDNAWKFVWAVPVAIAALGLAARTGRRSIELAALLMLIVLSAVNDSRSYLATFALTMILVVWQLRPAWLSARASWGFNAVVLGALGWVTYYLGSTLLVSGYLGADAQARSIAQIEQSGSLILGGRPELAATFALMRDHFQGFGPGAIPTAQDVLVAKTGMNNIGYAPNNGYVDKFMFGGHIELHSVMGDLWASYGVAGLLLVAAVAWFTIRGLAHGIAHKSASAALLFVCIWTLWNIAFSPFYAAEPTLLLTMGLVLLPATTRTAPLLSAAGRPTATRTAARPGAGARAPRARP